MTYLKLCSVQPTGAQPYPWPSNTCLTSWMNRLTNARLVTLMCATPGKATGTFWFLAAAGSSEGGWEEEASYLAKPPGQCRQVDWQLNSLPCRRDGPVVWPGTEYEYIEGECCWVMQMGSASLILDWPFFSRVLCRVETLMAWHRWRQWKFQGWRLRTESHLFLFLIA